MEKCCYLGWHDDKERLLWKASLRHGGSKLLGLAD